VKRKVAGASLIVALLLSATGLTLVNLAAADPIPYLPNIGIKSDGTVEPETEFIKRDGNVYTLTNDLVRNYAIKIQCSNIIFDGAGRVVNGGPLSSGYRAGNDGLSLQDVTNVTVRDLEISGFDDFDVSIENCSSCIIQRVKANTFNIDSSHLNIIKESKIAGNDRNVQAAIIMCFSNNNKFYRNNINGIKVIGSDSNIFFENNIVFQHTHIFGGSENNLWDNYSVGNYWSNYLTKYPDASEVGNTGIGDTPYVIDANNIDHYPLMAPVDNTAPAIEVLSPAPGTYNASSIQLSFTVDEPASPIAYSLDGKENITITGNITLTGLANGVHDLTIYAKDKTGNTGASETICFSVAVPFPTALVASVAGVLITGVAVCVFYYRKKRNH
jgi:hypothetical protein